MALRPFAFSVRLRDRDKGRTLRVRNDPKNPRDYVLRKEIYGAMADNTNGGESVSVGLVRGPDPDPDGSGDSVVQRHDPPLCRSTR